MKKLFVVLLIMMLFGCESKEENNLIWNEIVNKEYANFDVFAGQGVYFYEQDGEKRCAYMKYGSGVLIIGMVYHKVTVLDDGTLVLSQIELETPDGIVINESPVSDAVIIYNDGVITMNELEFTLTDFSHYEQFMEYFSEN